MVRVCPLKWILGNPGYGLDCRSYLVRKRESTGMWLKMRHFPGTFLRSSRADSPWKEPPAVVVPGVACGRSARRRPA